jgi:hypothetical protein
MERQRYMICIEHAINKTLQMLSTVRYRFDNCGDIRYPSIIVTTEPVRKAFVDIKNRGVKTRFITEITEDNLHHCKELMQLFNGVRRLDGVKGISQQLSHLCRLCNRTGSKTIDTYDF